MPLVDDYLEDYIILDRVTTADGYGGFKRSWQEGATVKAALTFSTSLEAQRAQKEGVTSVYTLTTDKGVVLKYHTVLKRAHDGKIFRVTSDGDDKYTPKSATLNMRQVTAEEWSLPDD